MRFVRNDNTPAINISVNFSVITMALGLVSMGTSGIFLGRLPIYGELYALGITLPWLLENVFTQNSKRLIQIIAITCYIILFYYQLHFSWGIL